MTSKEYEIWSGPFMVQGMDGWSNPHLHGTQSGCSFRDSVYKFAEKNPQFNEYLSERDGTLYHWGCKLGPTKESVL